MPLLPVSTALPEGEEGGQQPASQNASQSISASEAPPDAHTEVNEEGDRRIHDATSPTHIRRRNRRRAYLDVHPEYFGSHLEEADPLLYDSLVRQFQSPAEREAEGRARGYAGSLEADLRRGEARLDAAANLVQQASRASSGQQAPQLAVREEDSRAGSTADRLDAAAVAAIAGDADDFTAPGANADDSAADLDAPPKTQADALARWRRLMGWRFVRGADDDFDYAAVDNDEQLDLQTADGQQDAEDEYFGQEEPETLTPERLVGETGVQDY